MQKITTCLWFDNNAEEAVKLYTTLFKKSKTGNIARYGEEGAKVSGRQKDTVMTVEFELEGQKFTALNGGPIFKFTPAISFFVSCQTEKEVDELFNKLSQGGEILMPLDKYPFSERYGWTKDKYGVSWQIILAKNTQKITPCLLFVGKQHGKAQEAIKMYTSLFKNSKVNVIVPYEKGEDKPGIKHSRFTLDGQEFIAMDSGYDHQFTFTEATSFIVHCETQQEIDYFWEKLSEGGEKVQCGWLKDKFGISWQIIPKNLDKLLKTEKAMKELFKMKKIEIKKLEKITS